MKRNTFAYCCLATTMLLFASCVETLEVKPVCGTIDAPVAEDTLPKHVQQAMDKALKYHQYEIMSDTVNNVSVLCIAEADQQPTEGYGITVVKNGTSTTFASMRNTREPRAAFDSASGDLWLSTSAIEGTGVQVERLYKLRFQGDSAVVAAVLDPYSSQQILCQRLGYTTEGEQITFYVDGKATTTAENTLADMGGFDDDAVWIGENITYDLRDPQPRVCVTPGLKFVTGLVLFYDDMPTLTADVELTAEGNPELTSISFLALQQ